jgi:hypothetical protein
MRKLLLKMSLIFLTEVINSCAYDLKKANPEFFDPDRGYARVYGFRDVQNPQCGEPKYEPYYTEKNIPIQEMRGHVCFSTEQAQEMLRYYNEWQRRHEKCPEIYREDVLFEKVQ